MTKTVEAMLTDIPYSNHIANQIIIKPTIGSSKVYQNVLIK